MTDHRVELVIPLRVLRPQDHDNVGLDSKNDCSIPLGLLANSI